MTIDSAWRELTALRREVEILQETAGILEWDQQVKMPAGGRASRGRQLAALKTIIHDRQSAPRIGDLLSQLEDAGDALDLAARAGVRQIRREHDRATRIPIALVQARARAHSDAFPAWAAAREADDFDAFAPALTQVISLAREAMDALRDDESSRYDVALNLFDPGSTAANLGDMFGRLAPELEVLLDAMDARPASAHPAPLRGTFPLEAQRAFSRELIAKLGYDFERGRLDESAHPFTISFSPSDVRITTRLREDDLLGGLGGTVHETGHALYEQGLPEALAYTGAGGAAGFGMHESQSRFWENFIGRSLPFFRFMAPHLERHFPGRGITPERLFGAANQVRRGLIRVTSDEVTYNLHIIARFQVERPLLDGDLEVSDVRDAWDAAYERVVGVRPPDARDGVLQDVHWCMGAIGYFPSYTVGNLYAASLGATLEAQTPDLWAQIEAGEFSDVLAWLRTRIHRRGRVLSAPDLFREVVGDRDPVEDLVAHLWNRQGALYGVSRPS